MVLEEVCINLGFTEIRVVSLTLVVPGAQRLCGRCVFTHSTLETMHNSPRIV